MVNVIGLEVWNHNQYIMKPYNTIGCDVCTQTHTTQVIANIVQSVAVSMTTMTLNRRGNYLHFTLSRASVGKMIMFTNEWRLGILKNKTIISLSLAITPANGKTAYKNHAWKSYLLVMRLFWLLQYQKCDVTLYCVGFLFSTLQWENRIALLSWLRN